MQSYKIDEEKKNIFENATWGYINHNFCVFYLCEDFPMFIDYIDYMY